MVLLAVGLVSSLAELPADAAWLDAGSALGWAGIPELFGAVSALEVGVVGAVDAELAGAAEADKLGFTPASLSGGVILTE